VGAGLGVAVVCGIAWAMIEWVIPLFSFNLLIAPGVGYTIGEVISLSVNRKRATGLAIIGGVTLVVSYLVGLLFPWGFSFGLLDLLALSLGIFVAVTRLR
jgi:hypothetical protein